MSLECDNCGGDIEDGERCWSITPMRARRPRDRDGEVIWGMGLETHNRGTADVICTNCRDDYFEDGDSSSNRKAGYSSRGLVPDDHDPD